MSNVSFNPVIDNTIQANTFGTRYVGSDSSGLWTRICPDIARSAESVFTLYKYSKATIPTNCFHYGKIYSRMASGQYAENIEKRKRNTPTHLD